MQYMYYTYSLRFAWDPNKAESNRKKHGVTFEEAATAFADPLAIIVEDRVHAERSLLIGRSVAERTLLTVFVDSELIGSSLEEIRIISARLATKRERRRYEEGQEDKAE